MVERSLTNWLVMGSNPGAVNIFIPHINNFNSENPKIRNREKENGQMWPDNCRHKDIIMSFFEHLCKIL